MSFLSKAFVVLVTVLSILLVALVVPFVAEQSQSAENLAALQTQLASAEQRAELSAKEAAAKNTALEDQLAQLQQTIDERTQQVETFKTDVEKLTKDLAAAQARADQATTSTRVLATSSGAQADRVKSLADELKASQEARLTANVRIGELNAELAGKEQDLAVLRDQVRQLRETQAASVAQSRDLQRKVLTLQNRLGEPAEEAVAAGPVPVDGQVRGQITRVQTPLDNLTLVQVNVGAQDGVLPNMQFLVHRGETFLGNLIITDVERNAAVGKLELVQGQIKPGDSIRTGGI